MRAMALMPGDVFDAEKHVVHPDLNHFRVQGPCSFQEKSLKIIPLTFDKTHMEVIRVQYNVVRQFTKIKSA